MIDIKIRNKLYFIFIMILTITFTSCAETQTNCKTNKTRIVDIYSIVKEAFLTDKGYTSELSKHMPEDIFEITNIYSVYPLDSHKDKRPFNVDFSLKEVSQNLKKDIIYVKMNYSVSIKDSSGKMIGGSWDIPITFTVKKTGSGKDDWFIIDKYEPA